MKYMGGKYFLCKEISSVMKSLVKPEEVDSYIEPFCGALSVLKHMNTEYKCFASDYHPDLIQLWKEVQNDTFIPPENIDIEFYEHCKTLESPSALKAFVGFNMSFGGKFFSGYVEKYKKEKKEDFLKEAINSLHKTKDKLKGVDFQCVSYQGLKPNNSLIYCDPPYSDTKFPIKYRTDTKHYDEFNNVEFWEYMREWSKNNYVFISETTAPDDFIAVWEKSVHRSASQSAKTRYKNESDKNKNEKLYIHISVYKRLKLS
jgi:DNA adenine methylase